MSHRDKPKVVQIALAKTVSQRQIIEIFLVFEFTANK